MDLGNVLVQQLGPAARTREQVPDLIALRGDRKILILDEFTSALDAYTEHQILSNLRARLAGKTVIIIAHRLSTLSKLADKLVVLDRGRVIEEGTHQELAAHTRRYAELLRLQSTA